MSAKNSHSRARARTTPPASAADASKGPPVETVSIAIGPNAEGHNDQLRSVHVDEDGVAPEVESAEEA